ncbi:MAG TPA: chemotaxis protein CheA [Gemmatimonadaceae bacterium]|nr:chemotaxis protein CheA [Gemmatimonadaceae bacterium]
MDLTRYAELFLTESREHLSAINHLLLELERAPTASEPVTAIFRAVHTIKGMSATMGYAAVAALSHELETLLDRVRHGRLSVTSEVLDACFAAADALERAIESGAVEGGDGSGVGVDAAIARLRALGGAVPDAETTRPEDGGGGEGPTGQLVEVRLEAQTPLRGARAFLIVKRAQSLGRVHSVTPALEALQAERFDRTFSLRIDTLADRASIERTIRSVGSVEHVAVEGAGAGADAARSAARQAADAAAGRPARHVRMDLRRLDNMMNLIGELVITRGRLDALARQVDDAALHESMDQASRLISELQDEIMLSRMVPVWQVFDRFPRLVRDAVRSSGKEVELVVEGKEIELDRSMLDEIGDPVVHLLRNAIDHGIETPEERRGAGKSAMGRLTLSASRERSSVIVRVTDDGRGIDRGRVLAKARGMGLVDETRTELTDEELIRLIGRPGFSTAERVSDLSGRGVGIDVVYTRVRGLGGSVEIKTAAGRGTTVTMRLPVTLAIVRALLARVGQETYAVPITHVRETVSLERTRPRTVRGAEVLPLRDDVLPLMRFRRLLELPAADGRGTQVIVLEAGDRRLGLVVDELTGQQDIVVKQFDAVRGGAAIFSGATILPDGSPALILDVGSLL